MKSRFHDTRVRQPAVWLCRIRHYTAGSRVVSGTEIRRYVRSAIAVTGDRDDRTGMGGDLHR